MKLTTNAKNLQTKLETIEQLLGSGPGNEKLCRDHLRVMLEPITTVKYSLKYKNTWPLVQDRTQGKRKVEYRDLPALFKPKRIRTNDQTELSGLTSLFGP